MPRKREKRSGGGPRARVELDVDLASYGRYYLSKLENVSQGGAFIRTMTPQEVGTLVKLTFRLPDDPEPVDARAEVVWTYHQAGRAVPNSSGMGVRFTEIRDADRDRIAAFVQRAIGG